MKGTDLFMPASAKVNNKLFRIHSVFVKSSSSRIQIYHLEKSMPHIKFLLQVGQQPKQGAIKRVIMYNIYTTVFFGNSNTIYL